jgi:hypothetical protein
MSLHRAGKLLLGCAAVWGVFGLNAEYRVISTALAAEKPRVEPQLLSVFPSGAPKGSRSQVEIRGRGLEDAYAVWLDCPSITGEVKAVEVLKPDQALDTATGNPTCRASLELSVDPDASLGIHFIRLVTPRGVSNPRPFLVHQHDAAIEGNLPIEDEPAARRLSTLPLVVSGKISTPGEVDYYSFEAKEGEELFFEVLGGNFDPQVSVYEQTGSWFDLRRLNRLAFNDEANTASKNLSPVLTWSPGRSGRFLASVNSFLGRGGADFSYQLRIVRAVQPEPAMSVSKPAHADSGTWHERTFARRLELDRLKKLKSRTVDLIEEKGAGKTKGPATDLAYGGHTDSQKSRSQRLSAEPGQELKLLRQDERQLGNQGQEIQIPCLIEGTIDAPGDSDQFSFHVSDGARLALEIETPGMPAPFFTPRVGVFDEAGQEILNNVYAFVQGSGEFIEKVIESKVTYTFGRGGKHVLEIRGLTSQAGGAGCQYRVLVRPQIPHVGKIDIVSSFGRTFDGSLKKGPEIDRLNLAQGEAKRITALVEQEEGFDGEIAFSLEGLPAGVAAFPAAQVEPDRPRVLDEGKKERFRPGSQFVTVILAAAPDAPPTRLPHWVHVRAKPVVKGVLGPELPVVSFPLMVLGLERNPGAAELTVERPKP